MSGLFRNHCWDDDDDIPPQERVSPVDPKPDNATNEIMAGSITEKISKYCYEYDGYEGFKGINFKGDIYRIIKEVLNNGVDE